MNSATKRMDRQKKSGLTTNGLERRMATAVVGGASCEWRDGAHTERSRVLNEGIRLPVTINMSIRLEGEVKLKLTINDFRIIFKEDCSPEKRNESDKGYNDRKINAVQDARKLSMHHGEHENTHPKPTSSSP